jgi:aminodeoxyfutalosine deaminase
MMFITADQIHDGKQWLSKDTVIELNEGGTILALHNGAPTADVTYFKGVICPGFVNAHCHLELSHMKGLIPEKTGLMQFLQDVIFKRNGFSEEEKVSARHAAYQELYDNGVVAVGDISNAYETLDIRAKDLLHVHTFVESLGFNPSKAQASFDYALSVYQHFATQTAGHKMLRQSIVPHAPYSVSEQLFGLIDAHQPQVVMSLHNQETPDEDLYYMSKTGGVSALLQTIGVDDAYFTPTGKTSLQSYTSWLTTQRPLLLVHNTCTTATDVQYAQSNNASVSWCLCPNANLYIENRLPDIDMLQRETNNLCIGTDSLSSNHQLSVLAELKTIDRQFPNIGWETLLRWATYNGAYALQMDEVIGSIEVGKTPGIVLLKDYSNIQLLY